MVTLIATAVAFVMATATDQVFGAGVMWFAVSYIIIRLLGLGLFLIASCIFHWFVESLVLRSALKKYLDIHTTLSVSR